MYAMHPDTAEQVIKVIEALREQFGPAYRIPLRPAALHGFHCSEWRAVTPVLKWSQADAEAMAMVYIKDDAL